MTAKSQHPLDFQEVLDSTFRTSLSLQNTTKIFAKEGIAPCNFHSVFAILGVIF